MAPLEMNEGTTTVLGVGKNKLINSCSAEEPAKRPLTFNLFLNICTRRLIMLGRKNIFRHFCKFAKGCYWLRDVFSCTLNSSASLQRLSWNFIREYFSKIYRENSSLIDIRQNNVRDFTGRLAHVSDSISLSSLQEDLRTFLIASRSVLYGKTCARFW
jgi:hypothetical protein